MGKYLALLRNTDASASVDPRPSIPTPKLLLDSCGAAPEAVTPIAPTSPGQPRIEMGAVSSSFLLVDIVDAIACAPRSPFLNDLAIARAARALVEVERTMHDAPASIGVEVASVARNAAKLVADAIRAKRYRSAYDLLDNLTAKMRELKARCGA